MTAIASHLSAEELEARYKTAADPAAKSHFHAVRLLSLMLICNSSSCSDNGPLLEMSRRSGPGLLLRSNPLLNIIRANACCGRRELSHQVDCGSDGFIAMRCTPRPLWDLNAALVKEAKANSLLTLSGPAAPETCLCLTLLAREPRVVSPSKAASKPRRDVFSDG
jgi:hypothetical protein